MSKHEALVLERDSGNLRVYYADDVAFEDGCVHIENDDGDIISLFASEALSLLSWLEQHRESLGQKAQEDEAWWEKQRLAEQLELQKRLHRREDYEAGLLRLRPPAYREEAEEETDDE